MTHRRSPTAWPQPPCPSQETSLYYQSGQGVPLGKGRTALVRGPAVITGLMPCWSEQGLKGLLRAHVSTGAKIPTLIPPHPQVPGYLTLNKLARPTGRREAPGASRAPCTMQCCPLPVLPGTPASRGQKTRGGLGGGHSARVPTPGAPRRDETLMEGGQPEEGGAASSWLEGFLEEGVWRWA